MTDTSSDNPSRTPGEQCAPGEPVAPRRPYEVDEYGETLDDPWHWLRMRDDPGVHAVLDAENRYADAILGPLNPVAGVLYHEMVSRIQESDSTVPERNGAFYYYTRTEKEKQYAIHCRRHENLDAPEEIYLDENDLAAGHAYFDAGAVEPSPDHRLLAYAIDTRGNEAHDIYVRDLATGQILDGPIANAHAGIEWCNDNHTFYYITLDRTMRPYRLYRHTLGEPIAADTPILEEPDAGYFLGIRKTRSRRFIVITSESKTASEEVLLDANDPTATPRLVEPRRQGVEYFTEDHDQTLYIITNDDAREFRLVRAPLLDPGLANWTDVVAHRENVKLDDFDVFRDFLVVYERENALRQIRVIHIRNGDNRRIQFDESAYTVWAGENPEYNSKELRLHYSSPVTPEIVMDYNMETRHKTLLKKQRVNGYDKKNYTCERLHARARDGTRVPISVVYRNTTPRDGTAPLLLYGYGAYGASTEPYFVANRVSLLDRGVVFAIAHVRGGGECGRAWYNAGKLMRKRNTFTDFISCAEFLVNHGYAARGRVGCMGGSAGGLLVGASVNIRPDLWRVAVANVPFVDVVNTMCDPTIPLTVTEYDEWGNPSDPIAREYMRSYSPYDNVVPRRYPAMYVTAGWNDPRVQYWEPAKWVARLRAMRTNRLPIVLRTKMSEGHGGASGRYDYLRDLADEYAFVLRELGVVR